MNPSLRISLACAASALVFAHPTTAQATWVVDVQNGPGTHFTSLQSAIFTAAPGDRLLVRAGNYAPAVMDRPLTIVGESMDSVFVTGISGYSPGFVIQALPVGSLAAIEGITFAATGLAPITLDVQSGPGRVILDRVRSTRVTTAAGATDLRCTRCNFLEGLRVNACTGTLDRCAIGAEPLGSMPGAPGLLAASSQLHLDRCQVVGRDRVQVGLSTYPATAAIQSTASTIVLSGDGTGFIAAGTGGSTPAVQGSGVLAIDPHVVLLPTGTAPATAGVAVTTQARPSLAVDAGPPGGTVDIDLFGTPGHGHVAAVGVAIPPVDVPALGGTLWLDTILFWGIGQFGATGRVLGQVPVPNLSAVVGITFSWQAAEFGPGTITLSNAVSYVHPM